MLIFDQLKRNDVYLRTLTWSVIAGMLILSAGLYYVQIITSRHHSENQVAQSFRTVRIPAMRGKIMDRNRTTLVENKPSYTVGLYLEELRELFQAEWRRSRPPLIEYEKHFDILGWRLFSWTKTKRAYQLSTQESLEFQARVRFHVVSNIAHRLSVTLQHPIELDYREFVRHYNQQLALPLPLATDLTPELVARFQEQPLQIPGLDLDVQPYRHYLYSNTAAHVLGYLTRDDSSAKDEEAFFNYRLPDYRGRVGIEGVFDEELRGKAGVKSVLVNNLGYRQSETVWTPVVPGHNVVLTLDLTVQQAAEEALEKAMANTRGAAVVMDPWSGDILALASTPSFDPNLFIPSISHEDYAALSDTNTRPQINRAIQENYHPGSIFKVVTGLACLEAGLDPEKVFSLNARARGIYVGKRFIRDLAPEGDYNFRRAFLKSSNSYFITNGLEYGVEHIVRLGERLHLGERTGIPTAQEVPGNFPSMQSIRQHGWVPGDTANLCIGQGPIDVTPLQMAVMTAAIANGGKVLYPRLVDRIEPVDPASEDKPVFFEPGRIRDDLGVKPGSLKLVKEAMLADVEDEEGTGRASGVPGIRVCGKTGTAQVTNSKGYVVGQTTWFVSFAPYENPGYVVVVMVENGVFGGSTCAPVAKKIYETLLQQELERGPSVAMRP